MEQHDSKNGIINKTIKYNVKETIDRLEAVLISTGITISARIDQRAAAEAVGLIMCVDKSVDTRKAPPARSVIAQAAPPAKQCKSRS